MRVAASGCPERFLTLTCDPRQYSTPESALLALHGAWNIALKRLRRMPRYKGIEFFAVVERTEAGWPHFHVLIRGPYIPHALLSSFMAELALSPVVDIRRIKGVREAVRYVAKYIAKAPARFGQSKRYWQSRGWQLETDEREDERPQVAGRWTLDKRHIRDVLNEWVHTGWIGRSDSYGRLIYWRLGCDPPEFMRLGAK